MSFPSLHTSHSPFPSEKKAFLYVLHADMKSTQHKLTWYCQTRRRAHVLDSNYTSEIAMYKQFFLRMTKGEEKA